MQEIIPTPYFIACRIDGRYAVCRWYGRPDHYQATGQSFLTLEDAQHEIERRIAEEQAAQE